jgi:ribonuclease M5
MVRKLNIPYPVIVEGRYDAIKLSSIMEGQIITTDGFGVFNQKEKLTLIRRLSERSPIILLTDSDGAGKLIRSHITSAVPTERLIQLYIPRIKGKERRKERPSAEGTLGVEGMEAKLLFDLLAPYEDEQAIVRAAQNPLCKTDFFMDGLSGGENSSARRDVLAVRLGLPEGMTANALLAAVRLLCSYEEYLSLVGRESASEGENMVEK